MSSFLKRALSGAVLVAVMVAAILVSVETLLLLALLITAGSVHEFFKFSFPEEKGGPGFLRHAGTVLVACLMVAVTWLVVWRGASAANYLILLPCVFLLIIFAIYNKRDCSPMKRIGVQMTALVYIALPMSLLVALGDRATAFDGRAYNAWLVLFYVILIWINDVGAYLVGMTFGKHRLFERLSPKKSWEGFFGGLLFTLLAAIFLGPRVTGMENTPLWGWIIFGVVLTLSAVAGDLVESMFKREAGVKDSGSIIPGHGGLLDRFDAMFVSLPFVYVMVCLMG